MACPECGQSVCVCKAFTEIGLADVGAWCLFAVSVFCLGLMAGSMLLAVALFLLS